MREVFCGKGCLCHKPLVFISHYLDSLIQPCCNSFLFPPCLPSFLPILIWAPNSFSPTEQSSGVRQYLPFQNVRIASFVSAATTWEDRFHLTSTWCSCQDLQVTLWQFAFLHTRHWFSCGTASCPCPVVSLFCCYILFHPESSMGLLFRVSSTWNTIELSLGVREGILSYCVHIQICTNESLYYI